MKKKEKRVVALDTSTKVTGWALFIDGEYKRSGSIDMHKVKDSFKRTKEMCFHITNLIAQLKADEVVVEELPSMRNMRTVRALSRIIGAVFYYCVSKSIKYEEISCAVWRSVFDIDNRNRDNAKDMSINRVKKVYFKSVTDDEADAINIGEAYCIRNGLAELKEGKIYAIR